ncbi:bloodthirsty-related gene family, member 12 [Phyllopteryx taeniolatus]|uniref:bloodthirsty-related gene family, member 12 n=1 Tax=Phyllopteryx taeniolatus TaxID=161469 RepID=UPI002AD27F3A|nr:bloodthirsty-related gene family, member 12 [Phyllopteryx taeniolatus]
MNNSVVFYTSTGSSLTQMICVSSLGGHVLCEDQFSCSICLEVFVEPVSTPCGHSFCKACLQGYWNHSKKFLCPMCKKSYTRKPEMSVNRVLAEISSQFQGLAVAGGPEGPGASSRGSSLNLSLDPGSPRPDAGEFARDRDVPCDACIGRKLKAHKSCVNCPGSFCETHLRHHKKVKSLTSHRLIEPTFHLEDKICKKHERLLEVYCRTDHACICAACAETAHKSHDVVSTDHEWKKKMSNLGKKRSELKHLIKERAKKLEELKQSIKVIKTSAQKELEESWQVFAELQRLVEQSQAELVEIITTRQREAERHAQELARALENELSQLRRRSHELDAQAQTEDKVVFLQHLAALPPLPEPTDWSVVSINTDLYLGTIRSSVSGLVDKFQEELKRLYGKELRKVQNYASEVILDPATAQKNLVLSDDGRQVRYEERKTTHSEGPKRFTPALFILGREALGSGRHYWEVDVARKTSWTLGVANASARRKGEIKLSPAGGYWCLWLKNGQVKALASSRLPLTLPSQPAKVGIFLDYEGGQVSFYDPKARLHLYTFVHAFNESLYPIFSPCLSQEGKNASPLAITPVKHREGGYILGRRFVCVCVRWFQLVSCVSARPSLEATGMSSPGNLSEEQVHCSICLDVYTNPVSIPCGHNFCQACILGYWKSSPLYQCPMCKKSFYKRPDISVNTVLREIAEQFKEIRLKSTVEKAAKGNRWTVERRKEEDEERLLEDDREEEMKPKEEDVSRSETKVKPPEEPPASPPPESPSWQEVLCDVCLGEGRPKAVKSCLVCLTSYCEEHLRSHATRFTKHKLMEPVANMEDRMCPKHQRLLELFCKKDQTCVCVLCTETDHRAHYTVPVEREWTEKRAQLKKIQVDVQQMIQDRVRKVEEIKHSVELNKASAKRETEDSVQVFSELIRSIQRTQADVVALIEEKRRHTENRARDLVTELEREIEELTRRHTNLENMERTDHIHFLKNFPAMSAAPSVHDWTDTNVPTDVSVGLIRTAVSKLEATFNKMVDKLADGEIQKVLKYTADVTLDPDTANPWLQLSQDRRQVRHLGAWQDLPDHADRFDTVVIVLGREGFTSGRHYWEVQVGEKDDWYLGAAKSSVNRKGRISVSTAHGYWALAMKKGQGYRVSTVPPLPLALNSKPKRVGVYVDYEEGQISFYDVRARAHLYTFSDRLTEKILPFFYLYCCDKASDTVVICPVAEKALIQQS